MQQAGGANPRCGAPLGHCQGGEHGSESWGEGRQVCGDALRGSFQPSHLSLLLLPAAVSPLAQLRLCCARQPPQPLLGWGQPPAPPAPSKPCSSMVTATLLPRKLQPSPALALQQPFDPRCSNAAEDAFCTGPRAVCRPNAPQIFERKSHRESRIWVSSVRTIRN